MRILIAEDEPDLRRTLREALEMNRYAVDEVGNGTDALDYVLTGNYDGAVLDIMMPGMSGLDVLRRMRGEGNHTPVLLLTARSGVNDRIEGLDAGADDYLPKPFDLGELLARVRAMLRRREEFTPDILSVGALTLNKTTFGLACGGESIYLSGREFHLMEMLMEAHGTVVPTARIMEHIWGWDSESDVSIVWVYISNLRKKLVSLGEPAEIRAIRGVGYLLEEAKHG